jgi:hypothetical protein
MQVGKAAESWALIAHSRINDNFRSNRSLPGKPTVIPWKESVGMCTGANTDYVRATIPIEINKQIKSKREKMHDRPRSNNLARAE